MVIEYNQRIVNTTLHNKTYIPNKPKRNYNWLWLLILGVIFITIIFLSGCSKDNNTYLHLDKSSVQYNEIIDYFIFNKIAFIEIESDDNYIIYNNKQYQINEYLRDYRAGTFEIEKKDYIKSIQIFLIRFLIIVLFILALIYMFYRIKKSKQLDEWNDED